MLTLEKMEELIRACVPAGSVCDPQVVADAIREWCASYRTQVDVWPTAPLQDGDGADLHTSILRAIHQEAGRTLSRDDFDLCKRIAKRVALCQLVSPPQHGGQHGA